MSEPTPGDFEEKSFHLGRVFNPTSPINREDLFAGRQSQTRDVVDAINQRGQHAVLYGERGVGKTSLANVIVPKLRNPSAAVIAPQINCMTQDTYSDIWKRVFEEISFSSGPKDANLGKRINRLLKEYTGSYSDEISPDVVRRLLFHLGQDNVMIVILDEFDTIAMDQTRSMMSDTLKFLSDRAVPATVLVVGVSDDVEGLIANHRSLERCLRQIPMPRMSYGELETIVTGGLEQVGMTISPNTQDEIARIARGLPHYAHLLGLHSGRAALDDKRLHVSESHVLKAVQEAIGKAQASIQGDYSRATASSRDEALYKQVLLACAITETDDVGWFYPRNVRKPLERILGRPYKIESFARHLHAFCEDSRGPVLIVDDKPKRPRFRFENPLMEPYVLIRGIAEGFIKAADLKLMKEPQQGRLF